MSDARDIPMAIQWHEGMLLAPQHFQQLSVRNEELLVYHLACSAPFHWGIRKFKPDQTLLKEGIFRIQEIEAVMPDGLIVCHNAEDQKELRLDLSPYDEEMRHGPVTVHLAVPAKKGGDTASAKGMLPRFASAEGRPVADENTGESEVSIPRLRPRISLLVTDTPSKKYSSFPLSKIHYKDEMIHATDYVPPMLQVGTGSPVWEICDSLARRLREKAYFLSEKISAPSSPTAGPMILESKLLIRSMVSALPFFESVLHTGKSHPYPLYLALTGIVGSTASLGAGLVPPVLSPYNHNDIRASFKEAADYVNRVISEAITESHTPVRFKRENSVFSLDLKEEWMSGRLIVGARAGRGTDENQLTAWMRECLIGSESLIESMKIRRILGAARRKTESDGQLVPLRGTVLFSVDPGGSGAEEIFIKPNEKLKIFRTSDRGNEHMPTELILYVRNKS
ncbi:MAG: type VI secretion system baseplate subunit TssK [Desulfobacterales bacterium]